MVAVLAAKISALLLFDRSIVRRVQRVHARNKNLTANGLHFDTWYFSAFVHSQSFIGTLMLARQTLYLSVSHNGVQCVAQSQRWQPGGPAYPHTNMRMKCPRLGGGGASRMRRGGIKVVRASRRQYIATQGRSATCCCCGAGQTAEGVA